MRDERRLEDRIQRRKDCMMENTVANGRFVDRALLWIADRERRVVPVPIRSCNQFPMQVEDMFLEMSFEFLHISP